MAKSFDDIDSVMRHYDYIEEKYLHEPTKKYSSLIKPPTPKTQKTIGKVKTKTNDKLKTKAIILSAITVTVITIAIVISYTHAMVTHALDLTALRQEHISLLQLAETLLLMDITEDIPYEYLPEAVAEVLAHRPPHISAFDAGMRAINPNYIAWLIINGMRVNYPVVRGEDNERYLTTAFNGEANMFGTLFMDYRNVGETVPHIIIYGHNIRSGDMFGTLHYFLDDEHMARHPIISLLVNGRIVEYKIFSARKTDVNDPAYFLDFTAPGSFAGFLERNGAPADATQIITLSTCSSTGDDDVRVVIQGALLPE